MRLDKLLSECGVASRSECGRAARAGKITVNGQVVRNAAEQVDPDADAVVYCGTPVQYQKFVYLMLNKPDGYISATEDGRDKTVIDLLPEELQKLNLFPCGRLDKHTLGLVMLTDDGDLAHRLLSPKHHVKKKYRFECKFPLTDEEISYLEKGATLEDGYITKPSEIELDADKKSGYITLVEGKYHQIKRMLESVNNKITYLERVTFGPLCLDKTLGRGEWRFLSKEEIERLEEHR